MDSRDAGLKSADFAHFPHSQIYPPIIDLPIMKINLETSSESARIEILPLIDVIFCILTFFILAALGLTRQSTINVDLPTASTGTPQMRDMMLVSIDRNGLTYIDQDLVTEDQLTQRLLTYQSANPNGMIVLYASRASRYNDVVTVLDLLREVGGDRVALATLPESRINQDPAEFNPLDPTTIPGFEDLDPNLIPVDPFAPPSDDTSGDDSGNDLQFGF